MKKTVLKVIAGILLAVAAVFGAVVLWDKHQEENYWEPACPSRPASQYAA